MTTSLMMNTIDNNNVEQGYLQPVRRGNGGRRKAKNGVNEQKKKNKEPQRGMGVEKLERMRIQEILKNPLLNNNNNNSLFLSDPNLFNAFQYSKSGRYPNGQMGLFSFGSESCVVSNKNAGFKCQPEYYCTTTSCKKKKRFDVGNMGFGELKVKQDINNKMCMAVDDCGFLGLSVGENQNSKINQENLVTGFKTHLVHQVGYATRPRQPGVEVLAVHKKGGPSNNHENGKLVMEYEFFPGCKKDSRNDELVMMEQNMVAEEASTFVDEQITTCLGIGVPGPGFDASIDLSLKLS